ncbi:helix-turn-helix transcriptional regulator [Martelella endophytica]|uniref:helix-turn-helix transcriptional regulator n=1 Tax=Martelella endophytica TaxID=1486262 RepID=UPI000695AB29|nr:LuxR C-terminal-related transcriptional regulator [Martelella endophytica]
MNKINVVLESLVMIHEFETLPDIRSSMEKVAQRYGFLYFGLFERKIAEGGADVHWHALLRRHPTKKEAPPGPVAGGLLDDSWASLAVAHKPFHWEDALAAADGNPVISRKLQGMISSAEANGIGHGVTVPIFARTGLAGMLSVARDRPIDLSPLEMAMFETLAANLLRRCQALVQRGNGAPEEGFPVPELSSREFAILQSLADGLTSIEAGKALGLSNHTVDWYVSGLQEKLRARNRQNLIALAFRLGLVS